jgi:hypothetical protein
MNMAKATEESRSFGECLGHGSGLLEALLDGLVVWWVNRLHQLGKKSNGVRKTKINGQNTSMSRRAKKSSVTGYNKLLKHNEMWPALDAQQTIPANDVIGKQERMSKTAVAITMSEDN